jgi:hypothetical protein
MGYYFYNHPTDEYQHDLQHISAAFPSQLTYRNNKEVRVLGPFNVVLLSSSVIEAINLPFLVFR